MRISKIRPPASFVKAFLFASIFSALALGETSTALAQDGVDLDKVDLSDLLDVQIESASKQAEPLSEAPVPVTVITSEMIKLTGVRTVKDALTLFVPGYTESEDRNEVLFATRGIYATAQQKVLILINGHRINSRSYLTATPDHGIALHNVDRIEVLRGPGSSLYGNVALSGVVNIITKKGKDVKANMAEIGAGNHGQKRVRILSADGGDDWDMLAWGQYYRAAGEIRSLDGNEPHNPGKVGDIRIDGVENRSAHDFGINFRRGKWTFFGASRQSQAIEPYASGSAVYDYGRYRTFQETGPGLGMAHQHLGAKFESDLGDGWGFSFNPYVDRTEVVGILAGAAGAGTGITWRDQDIGMITQFSKNYGGDGGTGTLLVGAQIDTFALTESAMVTITGGELGNHADTNSTRLLAIGSEEIYSFFVQDKHKFNSQWILNGGARYDSKARRTGDKYEKLSPRLAIIHLPNDNYEFKFSYSQSFVDAPYWYRYNLGLPAFGGSVNLNPEVLEAFQLQTVWKSNDKRVRNATTLYYQIGTNLVTNRATAAGTPADPKYINSGNIETMGLENEFSWIETSYHVIWNLQYANALTSIDYTKFDNKFAHIPTITSNLVFNYLFSKEASINATVMYIGDQVYNSGTAAVPVSKGVDAATLLHLGGRVEKIASTGMFFDARVYNVLDTAHFQGGQSGTQVPFRQPGRWYMASIGSEF